MQPIEWRVIAGFPNYSVSNIGSVRNDRTGRILRQAPNGVGYLRVKLCDNGRMADCYVHRLVVQEFVGLIPEGLEVDHINHQRDDNRVENLRIASRADQTRNQASRNGVAVEWFEELPDGAEPLTEHHGREIPPGYYRRDREIYQQVGERYKRMRPYAVPPRRPTTRNVTSRVTITCPDGRRILISWTEHPNA
jgi:hypothetical protein